MKEVNVNFTYDGADYNVSFTPRESYYIHPLKIGDKEFSIRVSFTNNYISVYKVDNDPFSTDDNQIHVQKIKSNKIKASKFLEWYTSETEDVIMDLYDNVITMLFKSGKASLSVVDLFNNCGYIPSTICEYKDNKVDHYSSSDLLFEDDLTKIELTDHQKMYYYNNQI
jgi:hypothetical protein